MWKIYHASRVFKRSLLPNLGLPNQATGSLSLWFEENIAVTRTHGWEHKRGRSIGFMPCGNFGLCVKKFGTRIGMSSLYWARSYFRCQGAKRKYRKHKKIFEQGISVPEPYACLYEYRDDSRQAAVYIISQKIEDDTLSAYWTSHPTQADMLPIIAVVARIIADLHRRNYTHGDLAWNNIMLSDNKAFLIDLDYVSYFFRPLAIIRISMDITRFIVGMPSKDNADTNTVLSLFLRYYCEASGVDKSQLLIAMHKSLDKLKKRYLRKGLEKRVREVQKTDNILRQLEKA